MTHIRLATSMLAAIRQDLRRPHPFALERVGFVLLRGQEGLLVGIEYLPLHDDEYERAEGVGAQYSNRALKRMLLATAERGACAFNIHDHGRVGMPRFSHTDLRSLHGVVPGFFAMSEGPHGALLLSEDSVAGLVWTTATSPPRAVQRISEVGARLRIWEAP